MMNVQRISELLDAQIVAGAEYMDRQVMMGCGCDLMSHVLSHIKEDNTLLLTGLATPQVIYVSDAVDIKVICFVRGMKPEEKTISLANERGMGFALLALASEETGGSLKVVNGAKRGTKIVASFKSDSIDLKPMGDIEGTLQLLRTAHRDVEFSFDYRIENEGSA